MPSALTHLRGNVVAYLALFVALGGTSYAAVALPRNSVGAAQVKASAIRSSEVKDRSLLAKDFQAGQLPGAQAGAQGAVGVAGAKGDAGVKGDTGGKGDTGAAGTARAYGSFLASGAPTSPARVKDLSVRKPSGTTGLYCLSSSVSADAATAVVSTDFTGPANHHTVAMVRSSAQDCFAGEFEVLIFDATASANPAYNANFTVIVG